MTGTLFTNGTRSQSLLEIQEGFFCDNVPFRLQVLPSFLSGIAQQAIARGYVKITSRKEALSVAAIFAGAHAIARST